MSEIDLGAQVRAILEAGGGEAVGERRVLPLVTLDSGARFALDGDLKWLLLPESGPPIPWSPENAYLMHEPLEWKRARFDDTIEDAARALGLPALEVVFTFPAVEIVRAVMAKGAAYLTRLALEWIRPSELRELRKDILAVVTMPNIPVPVREFAQRLVVPL
jgi:hypothetical protein